MGQIRVMSERENGDGVCAKPFIFIGLSEIGVDRPHWEIKETRKERRELARNGPETALFRTFARRPLDRAAFGLSRAQGSPIRRGIDRDSRTRQIDLARGPITFVE